jgi:hypothetical protein
VVIEAGASSFAIDFALVQPEVAKETRVSSDRAGSAWSDARTDVETSISVSGRQPETPSAMDG